MRLPRRNAWCRRLWRGRRRRRGRRIRRHFSAWGRGGMGIKTQLLKRNKKGPDGRTDGHQHDEGDGRPTGAEQQIVVFCCVVSWSSRGILHSHIPRPSGSGLQAGGRTFGGRVENGEGYEVLCVRLFLSDRSQRRRLSTDNAVDGGDGDGSDFRVGRDGGRQRFLTFALGNEKQRKKKQKKKVMRGME